MPRILLSAVFVLAATAAVAQPATGPGPAGGPSLSPATAPASPPPPEGRMSETARMAMPHGALGPSIRLRGPGGAEVSVRCAAGESTRACADVAAQLIERTMASRPDRRRDDDEAPRFERFRERDRDRY